MGSGSRLSKCKKDFNKGSDDDDDEPLDRFAPKDDDDDDNEDDLRNVCCCGAGGGSPCWRIKSSKDGKKSSWWFMDVACCGCTCCGWLVVVVAGSPRGWPIQRGGWLGKGLIPWGMVRGTAEDDDRTGERPPRVDWSNETLRDKRRATSSGDNLCISWEGGVGLAVVLACCCCFFCCETTAFFFIFFQAVVSRAWRAFSCAARAS